MGIRRDMDRGNISSLREQYSQIPVPEEAKERVLQGIREARTEAGKETEGAGPPLLPGDGRGRKGWSRIAGRTAAAAAAALAVITVLANSGPSAAMAMGRIPVIGAIAEVVTFRTYESREGGFEAKVEVPEISAPAGETAAANREIEEYAAGLIAQYEESLRESQGEGHYSLESEWDVVAESGDYVSIRIRTTLVMASGTEFVKIFTVDKNTGETVSLADFLGGDAARLEAVSENIKEQMRAQMAADDSVTYFLDSDTPEWDFAGLTGEESFYVDSGGRLVVVFDEYQVAPGYMGAVEFTIPAEAAGELGG